ncbi:hypothetical protein [Glaciimonas soli]|uniref:hypothetical protein n=1 Tax=Glaciimonas soli TaxID=2590999 RepID=UPI001292E714|nr:hypothetical protein [Glaciimonas soli]
MWSVQSAREAMADSACIFGGRLAAEIGVFAASQTFNRSGELVDKQVRKQLR